MLFFLFFFFIYNQLKNTWNKTVNIFKFFTFNAADIVYESRYKQWFAWFQQTVSCRWNKYKNDFNSAAGYAQVNTEFKL